MPTYDYVCVKCNNIQEQKHSFNETPKILCEICGDLCEKQFTLSINFILKGNDWPSHEIKLKKEMSEKNEKMKSKMAERTKSGEAVTTLGQLKNKKL
jgi:putative FmdB family regulatory protein